LTNVARYAPGAATSVVLCYAAGHTTVTVEDVEAPAHTEGLGDVGGGRGLAGLRERVERAGGHLLAGPTARGWRVEVEVPG
jgi:signal transduction histidine kinase